MNLNTVFNRKLSKKFKEIHKTKIHEELFKFFRFAQVFSRLALILFKIWREKKEVLVFESR